MLLSSVGTAVAVPDVDLVSVQGIESRATVSLPADGHTGHEHQHLGAFEVEKEEAEKTARDLLLLVVVVFGDEPSPAVIAPWAVAPPHPIDLVAAHAARSPPVV